MLSHTVSLRYTHDIHVKKKHFRNKCIAYNSDGSVLLLLLDFKLQFFTFDVLLQIKTRMLDEK